MLAQIDLNEIQNIGLPTFFLRSGGRNTSTLATIINTILPYVFGAASIALLVYLLMGGLQLMLSKGDPKAVQSAQAKITNAIIGFVIVVIAFTLTQLIGQLLGLQNTVFGTIFGIK